MRDPAPNPEIAKNHMIPRSNYAALSTQKAVDGIKFRFRDKRCDFLQDRDCVVGKDRAQKNEKAIHGEHRFSISGQKEDQKPEWSGSVGEKVEECVHGPSGIAETVSSGNQAGIYRSNSSLPDRGVSDDPIFMKARLLFVAVVLLATLSAQAAEAFKLPSHVKELEDLDKAIAKAEKEQKGITFLLMEPGST